jgi:hypothetical protein
MSTAIPTLLRELVRLHDPLWDAQLTTLPADLIAKGSAALVEYQPYF